MRNPIACVLLLVVCLLATQESIAGSKKGIQVDNISQVPRISAELALLKYNAGNVVLVDTMKTAFKRGTHILGAINMPYDGPEDLERIKKMRVPFPKDQEILVYCH